MQYDDLLELVKQRRSIRRFKPDAIPDEYLDKIIELARWAPSGFNMQPWEFVVVREPRLRESIVQLVDRYDSLWQRTPQTTPSEPMDYRNAPVFIILCGDTRTKAGLPRAARFDHHQSQSIFNSGLASAFLYMHLAATSLGLASQWVTAVQMPFLQYSLRNLLAIPDHMEAYDMMVLGFPAMKPRPKLLRNTGKMVHHDHCIPEEFRTDVEVRDSIRRIRTWTIATIRRPADSQPST